MASPAVIARLFTQPVVLHRREPGPPDAYGDPTWVDFTEDALCYAEQASASEPGDPNYQADEWRFVFDESVGLDGVDAIDKDGSRFEVIGPPWPAYNPRTRTVHHVELRARATTP